MGTSTFDIVIDYGYCQDGKYISMFIPFTHPYWCYECMKRLDESVGRSKGLYKEGESYVTPCENSDLIFKPFTMVYPPGILIEEITYNRKRRAEILNIVSLFTNGLISYDRYIRIVRTVCRTI